MDIRTTKKIVESTIAALRDVFPEAQLTEEDGKALLKLLLGEDDGRPFRFKPNCGTKLRLDGASRKHSVPIKLALPLAPSEECKERAFQWALTSREKLHGAFHDKAEYWVAIEEEGKLPIQAWKF